ncbi:MAG: hypothetical protein ACOYNY_14000 [Caldilineaceae bacterium]
MDGIAINERQSNAQQISSEVDCYLATVLSSAYSSCNPTEQAAGWSLLIRYQNALVPQPCIVGRVLVNKDYLTTPNGTAGLMKLLTAEQIQEIRETAGWEVARQRRELARN